MITVGVDSYITLEYAESYMATASEEVRTAWESLDDTAKEAILKKSAAQIDNIIYTGQRKYVGQTMAFPRTKGVQIESSDLTVGIPENVRIAQIENAMFLLDTKSSNQLAKARQRARAGITKFELADWKETYGGTTYSVYDETNKLANEQVLVYLNRYRNGSFKSVI